MVICLFLNEVVFVGGVEQGKVVDQYVFFVVLFVFGRGVYDDLVVIGVFVDVVIVGVGMFYDYVVIVEGGEILICRVLCLDVDCFGVQIVVVMIIGYCGVWGGVLMVQYLFDVDG